MIKEVMSKVCSERQPGIYFELLDALQDRCSTVCSSDILRRQIQTIETVKTIIIEAPMEAERVGVNPEESQSG
jgi:hypothetical protein